MAMPTLPKTVFDRSLKLARAPLDAALSVTGTAESPGKRLLDQIEASTRSATGVLFHDDELRREGRAVRLASNQRQRAAGLRERAEEVAAEAAADRRAAEKRERERKAKAAVKADKEKKKAAEKAAQAKRKDSRVKAAATLDKAAAKDQSLDAEEQALAAEREADQIVDAAVAAKEARKNGNGSGR